MFLPINRAPTRAVGVALVLIILAGCGADEPNFAAMDIPGESVANAADNAPGNVADNAADDATGTRSVSIDWTAPTEYEDGSPFIDLAGYRIWYGRTPGSYSTLVEISPGTTSHTIHSLAAATYYFSITAYNHEGAESTLSNEVMIRLN